MAKPIKQKKNQKFGWISREDRNGWSLGLSVGKKIFWITNYRFQSQADIKSAIKSGIVFTHLADSNFLKNGKKK